MAAASNRRRYRACARSERVRRALLFSAGMSNVLGCTEEHLDCNGAEKVSTARLRKRRRPGVRSVTASYIVILIACTNILISTPVIILLKTIMLTIRKLIPLVILLLVLPAGARLHGLVALQHVLVPCYCYDYYDRDYYYYYYAIL